MTIFDYALFGAASFGAICAASYVKGFLSALIDDMSKPRKYGIGGMVPPPPPPGSRPPRTHKTPTVSEEMAKHGIPNAPDIMAGLVALKIAKMEVTDKWLSRDHIFNIELSSQRVLEVRVGQTRVGRDGWKHEVRVGMPGKPKYRTIELSNEGEAMILTASKNLRAAAEERQRHRLDVESNEAALEALEELL